MTRVPAELGLDNLEDAARVAERVVALSGERIVGFLVGAASPEMQKNLNTDEPYYAHILESNLCTSPANLVTYGLLTIGWKARSRSRSERTCPRVRSPIPGTTWRTR